MDEAQLVDEVEEEEGEEQRPANFLHALLDKPQMVEAAKSMPFVPGEASPVQSDLLAHKMQLLRLGARHRWHLIPVIEERPDDVVHVLALLVNLVRAGMLLMPLIWSPDKAWLLALSYASSRILVLPLLIIKTVHLQIYKPPKSINY